MLAEKKNVLAVHFRTARTPLSFCRYCCAAGMNYVVRSTDALLPITIHGGPRLVNFNDWLAHCNSQRNLVEGKR